MGRPKCLGSDSHNPESFGTILNVPEQNFKEISSMGGTKWFDHLPLDVDDRTKTFYLCLVAQTREKTKYKNLESLIDKITTNLATCLLNFDPRGWIWIFTTMNKICGSTPNVVLARHTNHNHLAQCLTSPCRTLRQSDWWVARSDSSSFAPKCWRPNKNFLSLFGSPNWGENKLE